MAASDPRAQFGAKLLHDGWETKQREKRALDEFDRSKELYKFKHNVDNTPYGGGLDEPTLPAPAQSMMNAGTMGAMSALGVPFTQRSEPTGGEVLPPLPDKGGALFRSVDPLRDAYRREGTPADLAKPRIAEALKQKFLYGEKGARPTVRLDGNGNLVQITPDGMQILAKKEPRSKGFFMSDDGPTQLLDNGQFRLADGTLSDTAPPGLTRIPGAMDEDTIQNRKGIDEDRDRNARLNAIKLKVGDLSKRRAEVMATRTQAEKAGNSELALQRWNEVKKIDKDIDDLTSGLTKEEKRDLVAGEVASEYESAEAVREAFKAGKLTQEEAAAILRKNFGLR